MQNVNGKECDGEIRLDKFVFPVFKNKQLRMFDIRAVLLANPIKEEKIFADS